MTTWIVTTAGGEAVSIGTVLADPLPAGLTARPLTTEQAAQLAAGGVWTGSEVSDPPSPPPDPLDALAEQVAALTDAVDTLILAELEG